jgi:hypothetical protein
VLVAIFAIVVIWPAHAPASALANLAADGMDVYDLQQQVRDQHRDWDFMAELVFREQCENLLTHGAGSIVAHVKCSKALAHAELQYDFEAYRPYEGGSVEQLPPQFTQLMLAE